MIINTSVNGNIDNTDSYLLLKYIVDFRTYYYSTYLSLQNAIHEKYSVYLLVLLTLNKPCFVLYI